MPLVNQWQVMFKMPQRIKGLISVKTTKLKSTVPPRMPFSLGLILRIS
jgi:hypothetical protein